MKRLLRRLLAVVAVLAIAWSLYSPIVILRQQGQIATTANAIHSVQGENTQRAKQTQADVAAQKRVQNALTKTEGQVTIDANYIVAWQNWAATILNSVCVSVHVSCPPPPVPPK